MGAAVKVIRSLIAGLAAGVLGWMFFMILYASHPINDGVHVGVESGYERLFATVFGALLGLALGLVEGINTGSYKQLQRAIAAFTFAGLLGGFIGLFVGQVAMSTLSGVAGANSFLGFFVNLVARTIAWGLWGVVTGVSLGMALGLVSGSAHRMKLASLGGAVGGILGGVIFQLLSGIPFNSYPIQTLLSFSCVAAGVAFFQALAQEIYKQAWVKVLISRGEGREYQIAKPRTVIGRDELADIPLFGDSQIERRHIIIQQHNGRYSATAADGGLTFFLNGKQVSNAPIQHGDTIQIASRQLQFFERDRQASSQGATKVSSRVSPTHVDEVPAGTCEYCGMAKNSEGECGCSVTVPERSATNAGQPKNTTTKSHVFSTENELDVAANKPGIWLQVIAGPLSGQTFSAVEGQSLLVGRAPEADISIPSDTFISRRHATIDVRGGSILIKDQGSANGTMVNGIRVPEGTLHSGDIIVVGKTQIRVG